jgi:nucleotide-binding universal stress UspA family protein
MRVVVAIDGSEAVRDLLSDVAKRRWEPDSEFLVLHVLEGFPTDPITNLVELTRIKRLKKKHECCAKAMLDDAAAFLSEHLQVDHRVHKVLTEGRIVDAIVRIAQDWSADLIVVGCHHHGLVERLLMGSITEGLISCASCSVEIVRPPITHRKNLITPV